MQTISDKNIERTMALIQEKYGFVPSELYVRDLLEFIEEMTDGPRE